MNWFSMDMATYSTGNTSLNVTIGDLISAQDNQTYRFGITVTNTPNGNESIIVIRGESKVNCFYNVCRHRGSHICVNKEGRMNKLVCPYHSWVYDLDGELIKARMMPENFNKKNWQLHKCHSIIFEGLIFINLSLVNFLSL